MRGSQTVSQWLVFEAPVIVVVTKLGWGWSRDHYRPIMPAG